MDPNVLAQGTLETLSLGSITGIVLATMFVVEILKRLLNGVAFFEKVPVFVYAIVISCILTFIAARVLKKDGVPVLDMDLGPALWAAIVAAAGASGFYSWLRPQSVRKAMADGSNIGPSSTLILIATGLLSLSGCQQDILPGNDPFVVNMERAGQTSYAICNSVVNYDYKNHDFMVAKIPQVHAVVQKIRVEFPPSYTAFRQTLKDYKANRTPANAQAVKNQLGVIQDYQSKAQDALNSATQAKGTSDVSLSPDYANHRGDCVSPFEYRRTDFASCGDSGTRTYSFTCKAA